MAPTQSPFILPTQHLPFSAPADHPTLSYTSQPDTPKQKRRRLLQLNTYLKCPGPYSQPIDPTSVAHAIWRYKINKARSLNASDAINTISSYNLEVTSTDEWRVVTTKSANNSNQESHQQKQYHVYFAPMAIENWASPILKKAGFTPKKIFPGARSAVECACSEMCFYNLGLQPKTNVPPLNDMYICEVCNQTYHWVCLKNTGCYTERQREEVDKNDKGACPGCAHFNDEQKQKRYSEPINTELIRVTWEPIWEPEKLKDT